jgi:hypothetical protein
MAMLADEEAQKDWREIFAVQVLGRARFEPAIDALVEKFGIDADVLREETQRALARICTPRVVESVLSFYPGKKWHVRLYAGDPLEHIKHLASEAGLLKLVEVERAMEAAPDPTDPEAEPLTLSLLTGLEESRQEMVANRGNPDVMDLCEGLLATALMCGVSLPEEPTWRRRIEEHDRRAAKARASMETLMASMRKNWRNSGMTSLPSAGLEGSGQAVARDDDFPFPIVRFATSPQRSVATIRARAAAERNTRSAVETNRQDASGVVARKIAPDPLGAHRPVISTVIASPAFTVIVFALGSFPSIAGPGFFARAVTMYRPGGTSSK